MSHVVLMGTAALYRVCSTGFARANPVQCCSTHQNKHVACCTTAHCNELQHIATHCNTLQHTTTHCNKLQHTATHCNTLQHTATHCNTLQHAATHCNTLQHTATHCNITNVMWGAGAQAHAKGEARHFRVQTAPHSLHTCSGNLSVLQYVAVWCSVIQCVVVCCSVMHCDAVCCSVLRRVVVRSKTFSSRKSTSVTTHLLRQFLCVAICCSVVQCGAVCCSVKQCDAVCRSVLWCVAV